MGNILGGGDDDGKQADEVTAVTPDALEPLVVHDDDCVRILSRRTRGVTFSGATFDGHDAVVRIDWANATQCTQFHTTIALAREGDARGIGVSVLAGEIVRAPRRCCDETTTRMCRLLDETCLDASTEDDEHALTVLVTKRWPHTLQTWLDGDAQRLTRHARDTVGRKAECISEALDRALVILHGEMRVLHGRVDARHVLACDDDKHGRVRVALVGWRHACAIDAFDARHAVRRRLLWPSNEADRRALLLYTPARVDVYTRLGCAALVTLERLQCAPVLCDLPLLAALRIIARTQEYEQQQRRADAPNARDADYVDAYVARHTMY